MTRSRHSARVRFLSFSLRWVGFDFYYLEDFSLSLLTRPQCLLPLGYVGYVGINALATSFRGMFTT